MNGHQPRDQRPANCRNRMRSEAGLERDPNPYTTDCGSCGFSGACPHDRRPEPPTTGSGVQPARQDCGDEAIQRLKIENVALRDALRMIEDQYVTHRGDMSEALALTAIKVICTRALSLNTSSKVEIVRNDRDTRTGRVRIANSWLGWFGVVEEEVLCIGGALKWRRMRGFRIIAE